MEIISWEEENKYFVRCNGAENELPFGIITQVLIFSKVGEVVFS
jgi:hypothetical protein